MSSYQILARGCAERLWHLLEILLRLVWRMNHICCAQSTLNVTRPWDLLTKPWKI